MEYFTTPNTMETTNTVGTPDQVQQESTFEATFIITRKNSQRRYFI